MQVVLQNASRLGKDLQAHGAAHATRPHHPVPSLRVQVSVQTDLQRTQYFTLTIFRCKTVPKMQEHIKHVHDGEQRPIRPRKRKMLASLEESDEDERGADVATASEVIADKGEDVKVNRNKLSPNHR